MSKESKNEPAEKIRHLDKERWLTSVAKRLEISVLNNAVQWAEEAQEKYLLTQSR
jgi:hypothetical protein